MKHNTKAFTLIELMVVVTIMAIIGTMLVTPFKMLFDGMSTRDRGQYIADMIRSLDESIEKNQAESYEAVFESGSIGFVTNQDWYKKSPVITGTFDFETGQ